MIHLVIAGALHSTTLLAVGHPAHHNGVHDIARWIVHATSNGFGWWTGRTIAEQLGLGGIAAVALTAGALWIINRATGGTVARLWHHRIGHRIGGRSLRL